MSHVYNESLVMGFGRLKKDCIEDARVENYNYYLHISLPEIEPQTSNPHPQQSPHE